MYSMPPIYANLVSLQTFQCISHILTPHLLLTEPTSPSNVYPTRISPVPTKLPSVAFSNNLAPLWSGIQVGNGPFADSLPSVTWVHLGWICNPCPCRGDDHTCERTTYPDFPSSGAYKTVCFMSFHYQPPSLLPLQLSPCRSTTSPRTDVTSSRRVDC